MTRKITEGMISDIALRCREGIAFNSIAGNVGIPRQTLKLWIDKGRALAEEHELGIVMVDGKPVVDFEGVDLEDREAKLARLAILCDHARSELQRELVGSVRLAARGRGGRSAWKASIFLLERVFREDWCAKTFEARQEAADLVLRHLRSIIGEDEFNEVRRSLSRAISD